MFRLTPVVKGLLIVNVVIFLLSYLLLSQTGIDIINYLGLYYFASDNFEPWQFVTYMFLHSYVGPGGQLYFGHIFGNMIGLLIFGAWLEEVWGPQRFFQYYIITGIGAGILFMGVDYFEKSAMQEDVQTWMQSPDPYEFELLVVEHFERAYPQVSGFIEKYKDQPEDRQMVQQAKSYAQSLYKSFLNIPMVGASGAVFGILMAAGLLFPQRRIMLLIPPIPMRARILVVLYGAYEIYAIMQRAPTDNVAHFAHLGGMLVGFILLKIWNEDQNRYQ